MSNQPMVVTPRFAMGIEWPPVAYDRLKQLKLAEPPSTMVPTFQLTLSPTIIPAPSWGGRGGR